MDLQGRATARATGLALAALLAAAPLSAQTLRGLLLERGTDRPIELGEITMLDVRGDTVATALSDANGLFSVSARDGGSYRLVARALGYRAQGAGPYEVDDDGMLVVQLLLEAQPVDIEGIDVEAEALFPEEVSVWLDRQGFYERRDAGLGHFLGPRELAELQPMIFQLSELYHRVPGVRLGPGREALMTSANGVGCAARIFVDGVLQDSRLIDRVVGRIDDLDGIEIYTRTVQIPLQYQWAAQLPDGGRRDEGPLPRSSSCGIILIWTKH